jgi:DNA-binding MarR family transcriptional regulator
MMRDYYISSQEETFQDEESCYPSHVPPPIRDGVDDILDQWRHERPDLDPAPIGVIGRISRLAREIEQRLEAVYREHGLEPGWHDVLATLRRSGPPFRLRPTDLTTALMLTSSGTTKRLDRLERAGLVERTADQHDRRAGAITLTAHGRALIDRVTQAHLANERDILRSLPDADQQRLADLLRSLQVGLPPLDDPR